MPARRAADTIDGPPIVTAKAWAVFNGRNGERLHGDNDSAALPMASTTKIMTAFLVLRLAADNAAVLDETVVVTEQAARTAGSSARIRTGDRIAVRELLYGLLLPSGNDAAVAVAQHFGARFRDRNAPNPPTPLASFVEEMNRHAGRLMLRETRYLDPNGLSRNETSARDLTKLAYQAMQNATFRQYVQTRRHQRDDHRAPGENAARRRGRTPTSCSTSKATTASRRARRRRRVHAWSAAAGAARTTCWSRCSAAPPTTAATPTPATSSGGPGANGRRGDKRHPIRPTDICSLRAKVRRESFIFSALSVACPI